MARNLVLVMGVSAAFLTACSSSVPKCDGSACKSGCCDSSGECLTAVDQSAMQCGAFGEACHACPLGQLCSFGICVKPVVSQMGTGGGGGHQTGTGGGLQSGTGGGTQHGTGGGANGPTCNASSCPNGCCSGGVCVSSGVIEDSRCGRQGVACYNCVADGYVCVNDDYCDEPVVQPPDAGPLAAFDYGTCTGPASASGTIGGQALQGRSSEVTQLSSGMWNVLISPRTQGDVAVGDRAFIVQFSPRPGQFNYPSGSAFCGVVEFTQTGVNIIDSTQLCELRLATPFDFASANGVCDGLVGGTVQAVFGVTAVAATFVAPHKLLAPTTTRCGGTGESCGTHSDCCAQSCSPVLGVCN